MTALVLMRLLHLGHTRCRYKEQTSAAETVTASISSDGCGVAVDTTDRTALMLAISAHANSK